MVQLTPAAIAEFKAIYKERFGEKITNDRAAELGSRLMRMMDVIYKPVSSDNLLSVRADDFKVE